MAVGNSIQAYSTLLYTQQVYCGTSSSNPPSKSPANALSSRTFGTWSLLSAVVRLYAAYNIDDPVVYQLAFWTYAIACAHFFAEWQIYRTTAWGRGLAGPILVSTSSLIWMWVQKDRYVG